MAQTKIKTGKNIVLCLDGTGNQFRENNTNVVKLYRVLERNSNTQIAYYDPGVGTLAESKYKATIFRKINKNINLALGFGLKKNIEEAYSYLMENYQDGDRIFIFGFSRGAYTARALAGLIMNCGLLDKGCQNLIPYAMKLYKDRIILDFSSGAKFAKSLQEKTVDFETIAKFKAAFGRKCEIHFLGLWDTVRAFGWIYNPIFLPNTIHNDIVNSVRHAIAIDERRSFYTILHWGDKRDVKEVWFSGVHSDIGGGYSEERSGLAKFTLKWMIEEAIKPKYGLKIIKKNFDRYVMGKGADGKYIGPDANAKPNKSLKGKWWFLQILPKKVYDPEKKKLVLRLPRPLKWRYIEKGTMLHESVLTRIKSKDVNYRPANLNLSNQESYPTIKEIKEHFKIVK